LKALYRRIGMKKYNFFMAPDDGGADGGTPEEKDVKDTEIESLKQQLEEQRAKAEEAEKRLKENEDAKLSEEEKREAQQKEEKAKTVSKFKELQAKALGLDAKYVGLIQGENAEDIEKSATLLSQMLKEKADEVEKNVKQQVANTGAPGASAEMKEAVEPSEYYKNLLKTQKG
jgi:hypothetical protein